jgi:hypothetical protein
LTRPLWNANDLMHLQAQPPLGVSLAIGHSQACILLHSWAIHGLQEKVLEGKVCDVFGVHCVGEDELELASLALDQGAVWFGADREPVDAWRGSNGPIRFNCDLKAPSMAGRD